MRRAFGCLWYVQTERLRDAQAGASPSESENGRLDDLLQGGESYVDDLIRAAEAKRKLIVVTLPYSNWLFFTDLAYFLVPIVGQEPLAALPVSPVHFVCMVRRECRLDSLRNAIKAVGEITALSVGPSEKVTKVIVPPFLHPEVESEPEHVRDMIQLFREIAPQLFNITYEIGKEIGLNAWRVD